MPAADAQTIDQATIDDVWLAIGDLQTQVETIELMPGPAGPQGEQGLQGPQGPSGESTPFSTYVVTKTIQAHGNQPIYVEGYVDCMPGDIALSIGFVPDGDTTGEYLATMPSYHKITKTSNHYLLPDHSSYEFTNSWFVGSKFEYPNNEITAYLLCADTTP